MKRVMVCAVDRAQNFTHQISENADSYLMNWNILSYYIDSTMERVLVWVNERGYQR